MDPVAFLIERPPFDALDERQIERLRRALEIVFAPRGQQVFTRGESNDYVLVIRKGAVRLELDGRLVDELARGELIGVSALLSEGRAQLDAIADPDCLFYRLPSALVRDWMSSVPRFSVFFVGSLADRLRRTAELEPVPSAGDLSTPVARLVTRPLVEVPPEMPIRAVAARMRDERVDSILVRQPGERGAVGIVTDRDLRNRVLAEGRSVEDPVASVMTSPVFTVDAEATLFEALLKMLREHVGHLPVAAEGEILGLVTHSDMLRHHVKSPAYLLSSLDRSIDGGTLSEYAADLAGMVESLVWGKLDAVEIGKLVATINDALVNRLLRRAERELGEPPCAYRWIVYGSEGRYEQALLTDQDNGLIFSDDTPDARDYFHRLATRVVGSLEQAGFPACTGGYMATRWCFPRDEWVARFARWGESPDNDAVLEAHILLDFRAVGEGLDLEPLERAATALSESSVFMARLAKTALHLRPPLGLLRRIRLDPQGVDIKRHGLVPIVGLARVVALEHGLRAGSTIGRLRRSCRVGGISAEGAEELTEAFRFLFSIRLREQLGCLRRGDDVSNVVDPAKLTPLERRHLKHAFLEIRNQQDAVSQRYQLDLMG